MNTVLGISIILLISAIIVFAIKLVWYWAKRLKDHIERHMKIMENIDSYLWYETEWGKDRRKLKKQKESDTKWQTKLLFN